MGIPVGNKNTLIASDFKDLELSGTFKDTGRGNLCLSRHLYSDVVWQPKKLAARALKLSKTIILLIKEHTVCPPRSFLDLKLTSL